MFEKYNNINKIQKSRYKEMHDILKTDFINRYGIDKYSNFNEESYNKWINMIRNDTNYNIILYIIDNKIGGFICYIIDDSKLCLCEVQIKKEYQGKYQIFRKMLNELVIDIKDKKITKVVATIDKDNEKSKKVFTHIGMVNTNKNWYEIEYNEFLKWINRK